MTVKKKLHTRRPAHEVAATRLGKLYPIRDGSSETATAVDFLLSKSGQGAWIILDTGHKVYVLHKSGQPIAWRTEAQTV
jgi:hypothetical protein